MESLSKNDDLLSRFLKDLDTLNVNYELHTNVVIYSNILANMITKTDCSIATAGDDEIWFKWEPDEFGDKNREYSIICSIGEEKHEVAFFSYNDELSCMHFSNPAAAAAYTAALLWEYGE